MYQLYAETEYRRQRVRHPLLLDEDRAVARAVTLAEYLSLDGQTATVHVRRWNEPIRRYCAHRSFTANDGAIVAERS